ncbi:hypothetical protein AQUCO_00200284v1 [Aquilegia coerulea]|uniref:Uncharacterized protein n=1 Tax=Aquilegia coerulea TaxID=218851 RepID=A0A2G5F2F0_AQUCA|nr:hypothetical protein AQUCO_00200284v1 [Aquilegia coerulea]
MGLFSMHNMNMANSKYGYRLTTKKDDESNSNHKTTREWAWSLKHKINLELTMEDCPGVITHPCQPYYWRFIAFHPTNPLLLFLDIKIIALLDMNKSRLEAIEQEDGE